MNPPIAYTPHRRNPIVWAVVFLAATLCGLAWAEPTTPQPETPLPTWPKLTDEEHAQAINEIKAFSRETYNKVSQSLKLVETKFFIFCSDLPDDEIRQWSFLMDRMYHRLCDLFAVERDTNIWRGKAMIVMFSQQNDYKRFWSTMTPLDVGSSAGMCWYNSNGRVVIAFYRQPDDMDFANILVHESVHGFLHRHRSPVHVVSWANEGLADLIAHELVPKCDWTPRKQRYAVTRMKRDRNMGGDFFTADHIHFWQYGIASHLTQFMIKQNKKRYVAFINGIKDGQPWEQSLEKNYGTTLSRLVEFYGRSIGIRSLKP